MSSADVREPRTIAAEIGRTKRYRPDTDTTELYRDLHLAHIARKAREVADRFPPLREDQIQTLAEILRGESDR